MASWQYALPAFTLDLRIYPDGCILDGRNRYRPCISAGVDARFETYHGPGPIAYAISLNLRRRHLNESQRAMIAAGIANLRDGQRADLAASSANLPSFLPSAPPIPVKDAARMLNVSDRLVTAARAVREHAAPELAAKVERGEVSVSAAADVARLPVDEQDYAPASGSDMTDAERNLLLQVAAALAGIAGGMAIVPMKAGGSITRRPGCDVAKLLEKAADAVRAEQKPPGP